jgi:hypothetical protein
MNKVSQGARWLASGFFTGIAVYLAQALVDRHNHISSLPYLASVGSFPIWGWRQHFYLINLLPGNNQFSENVFQPQYALRLEVWEIPDF